jgi:hypothetical protein
MLLGSSALASTITYVETVTATGSLGGTAFTDSSLSFSMSTSTTSDIPGGGGSFFTNFGPLTVTVAGIGTATFSDSVQATLSFTLNPMSTVFGFGDITNNFAILFTDVSGIVSYGGLTSFGPVFGDPVFNPGISFGTTDGSFILNETSGESSFAATATAVPEPGSCAFLATGLLAVAFARLRRSHKTSI